MTGKVYVYDAPAALFRPLTGGTNLTYVPPPPPSAPTGVTISAVVADGWRTSWSAATGAPTGYRVFVNGVQQGADLAATTLLLDIGGQAAGTYSVTVKAFNAFGVSPASSTASVTVTGTAPTGAPDAPTGVTHTAITATGWTTTWAPASTGATPTGYRVFVNGVKYGSDLAANVTSLVITGQTSGTYTVKVKAFNAAGASVASAPDTVVVGATAPPGLIAGKVLLGWYAAKQSVNNDVDHASVLMDARNVNEGIHAWWQGSGDYAKTIPAGLFRTKTNVFKEFHSGGFMSKTELLGNLADADDGGYFLCQTTKVDNANWAAVANGDKDAVLGGYANVALARMAKGLRPFALSLHHEPNGDGYDGVTRSPALWAAMQIHASYFFAGWRKKSDITKGALPTDADAVYHSDLDTRPGMSSICIPNGFLITGTTANKNEVDSLLPPALVTAYNTNHGIISPDIYDNTTVGKRVYDKINAWAKWCRDNGALHAGITETGCYDRATIVKLWAAVKANADVFRYVIYWDSGIGEVPQHATDWRLLPNGYPADSDAGANPTKPFVGPGTAVTEGLLTYWRDVALPEAKAM